MDGSILSDTPPGTLEFPGGGARFFSKFPTPGDRFFSKCPTPRAKFLQFFKNYIFLFWLDFSIFACFTPPGEFLLFVNFENFPNIFRNPHPRGPFFFRMPHPWGPIFFRIPRGCPGRGGCRKELNRPLFHMKVI